MANTPISYLKFGSTTYQINDKTALHSYTLPTASSSVLGGIKASNVLSGIVTLTSSNGSTSSRYYGVQVDNTGKAFVNVPWTDHTYTIGDLMGLSTIGKSTQPIYWNGLSFKETSYAVNATVPATAVFTDHTYSAGSGLSLSGNQFTLNVPTSNAIGGIKTSNWVETVTLTSTNGATANRYYGVQQDKNGLAFVNIPWTDTNTHPTFTSFTGKPTANTAPGFGGTFTISQISQNTSGQVSGTDRTVTIPNSTATTSANGLMTSAMVTKLNGIASGANNYSLPTASSSTLGGIKTGFTNGSNAGVFDFGIRLNSDNNAFVSIPSAGVSDVTHGLMGKDEHNKLAGIESGANNYTHPSHTAKSSGLYKITVDDKGHVSGATAVAKSDITGLGIPAQDTTYGSATTAAAGLMTSAMVTKLNGIASGANAYSHPTYTSKSSGLYKITVDGTGHVSGTTAVTKADITGLGIPGSNTNTTYGASTGLSLSGTAFSLKVATGDANGDEIGGVKLGRYNHSGGSINEYSFIPYYVGSTEGDAVNPEKHYSKFSLQMFSDDDAWANIAYIGIPTASTNHPGLMHQKYVEDLKLVRNMFTNIAGDTTINSTNGATTGKNYGVQVDNTGKAFVNVPWTDNNTTYGNATTTTAGLMTSAMVTKLNSIESGANAYTHPSYTPKTSGLYKIIVDNKGHVSGTTAVTKSDITGLGIPGQDTTYSVFGVSNGLVPSVSNRKSWDVLGIDGWMNVPYANSTYPGGIKIGFTQNGQNYPVELDESTGKAYVNVPWTNTNTTYSASTGLTLSGTAFSLNKTTASSLGGIIASNVLSSAVTLTSSNGSTSSRYYGVQVDSTGKAFVNVPWKNTDTNTTYSPSTGLGLSGTDFYLNVADTVEIGGICVTNAVSTRNNINSTNGNTSGRNYGVQINGDDEAFVNVPWTDNNTQYSASTGLTLSGTAFSLNKATASSLGGIKASNVLSSAVSLTSSNGSTPFRYYGVQVDNTGKAFVNVPWNNTTYSMASSSQSGILDSSDYSYIMTKLSDLESQIRQLQEIINGGSY